MHYCNPITVMPVEQPSLEHKWPQYSTDCSRCHEEPALSKLALWMQEVNMQLNNGSEQHIFANFVKRGLIRGEQVEQKESERNRAGLQAEGGQTHPEGRQREAL